MFLKTKQFSVLQNKNKKYIFLVKIGYRFIYFFIFSIAYCLVGAKIGFLKSGFRFFN